MTSIGIASSSTAVTSSVNMLDWHAVVIAAMKFVLGRVDGKLFGVVLPTEIPRMASTARMTLTKFFWTNPPSKQGYERRNTKLTISISGRFGCIRYGLVDGFNSKYVAEDRVEVRQGCHDGGPHQCTMVIVWRLYIPVRSGIKIRPRTKAYVELDIIRAPEKGM